MNTNSVGGSLRKVLSQHGHGFHYAVLRCAERLSDAGRSGWILEAAEFPVQVGESVTHIDFVLRHKHYPLYMVAECKRADPAKALWCFVRAPYIARNTSSNEVLLESISYRPPDEVVAQIHSQYTQVGNYHLSVELKTHQTGDGVASRSAATDAATQVLRGMNGLVNHLFARPVNSFPESGQVMFLPVIFTTAEVWTSTVDVGEANLETGNIPELDAEQRPWIWFTHNQSAVLRHRIEHVTAANSLSESLRNEFARSIVVVGKGAVETFLSSSLPEWLMW
jgi:hypothetical protein